MSRHVYPLRQLLPDYARAGAGFVATTAPLPWLAASPVTFWIATGLAVAFAAYGGSTAVRQLTRIEADNERIRRESVGDAELPWTELTAVDLRYYSVRRDRKRGWMQLRVSGAGQRIVLDSALEGFGEIVRRAAEAAAARGLPLTDTTEANLRAMGIEPAAPARDVAAE